MQHDYSVYMEVKSIDDEGTFEGIASVYEVEDLGGDIIEKGAFRKTISENSEVRVLWQHEPGLVIGSGVVSEWQNKIRIKGKLDLEDPQAVYAHGKMKRGLITGLSIGFQTLKHIWEESGGKMIRRIQELKLYEVSVVTFPMLPAAQVTRVKSEDDAILQRIDALQAQVSALQAAAKAEATLKEAGEGEGAASQTSEPNEVHSVVIESATSLKEALNSWKKKS